MKNKDIHQRILIIGPSWVGDMVMAQGLLKLLKQQNPHCLIDVLAPPATYPLLEFMPEVNQAILLPLKNKKMSLKARWKMGKALRQTSYTQAIFLKNTLKSTFIPLCAGIPKRTGWVGESRWLLINDIRFLDKALYPRMIDRFYALGLPKNAPLSDQPALLPALRVTEKRKKEILKKLNLTKGKKPLLMLCPGAANAASKRWPAEHYGRLAVLGMDLGWQVWIAGGAQEKVLAEVINRIAQNRCVDLTGKTTLAEAVYMVSLADKLVANDSGLMHVAAALGVPLVGIYGSTSPTFAPPLAQAASKARILYKNLSCQPCVKPECPLIHFNCMRQITPEDVLAQLQELK